MRKSGVLLHISSLPSAYGIGTLGKSAYDFLRFLKDSGQSYWEMLPINPTGFGDSPYSSFSAFASNPYFIDLEFLVNDGLLTYDEINGIINYPINDRVDYGKLYETRFKVLRIAYHRFNKTEDFYKYIDENPWLKGYASFMTLKNLFNGMPWYDWEIAFRNYHSIEVSNKISENIDEYYFWCYTQYIFDKQFISLKNYAHDLGIKLIGDLPIYVSYDSSDVWCNPEYFDLDSDYIPRKVSGVPPDAFSETGQLWGNPIYNFEKMKSDGYIWWINRFKQCYRYFDMVRIDHFRGFDAYWAVPYGSKNAISGKWYDGPGYELFDVINKNIPNARIIAEDLGVITKSVEELLAKCGYPGMRILEFGFNPNDENNYTPHNLTKKAVVYPGTHDNQTIKEWFRTLDQESKSYVYQYLGINNESEEVVKLISCCLASPCEYAIVRFADWLEKDSDGRMNIPNTQQGNWTYRVNWWEFSDELKQKMLRLTKIYKRC